MYEIIKRLFDVGLSLVLILIISPVLILIILILKFTGEGEVFFNQSRLGRDQKEFKVHKFVTMRTGSEKVSTITEKGDPRVLPIGKFLRFTKINELPQLFNVFKGEMSFVGPRPLAMSDFSAYPDEIKPELYMGVMPGVTGVGSVLFRDEQEILFNLGKPKDEGYRDIMAVKARAELWYKGNRGLWTDFILLAATAFAILLPRMDILFFFFKTLPFKEDFLKLKQFR